MSKKYSVKYISSKLKDLLKEPGKIIYWFFSFLIWVSVPILTTLYIIKNWGKTVEGSEIGFILIGTFYWVCFFAIVPIALTQEKE